MSRYFVLDGPDGCGKSSQARALSTWLQAAGHPVLHVREPGSTPVGEALRQLLLAASTGPMQALTEALLFSAARSELVHEVIAPALRQRQIVVAERCYLSTVVYQGFAGDVEVDWLFELAQRVHGQHLPDRIFVLDVPAATAAQRRRARTQDRFEERGEDYHAKVREGFLRAKDLDSSVRIVDATPEFGTVQNELRRLVTETLA